LNCGRIPRGITHKRDVCIAIVSLAYRKETLLSCGIPNLEIDRDLPCKLQGQGTERRSNCRA
jgi:hypothetical protein